MKKGQYLYETVEHLNPLTLKQTCRWKLLVCLSMYELVMDIRREKVGWNFIFVNNNPSLQLGVTILIQLLLTHYTLQME